MIHHGAIGIQTNSYVRCMGLLIRYSLVAVVISTSLSTPTARVIPYPRANKPVALPPRRTGGSFISALTNGKNNFQIAHAWTLR